MKQNLGVIKFESEQFPTRIIAKYVSKADVSNYKSKQRNL